LTVSAFLHPDIKDVGVTRTAGLRQAGMGNGSSDIRGRKNSMTPVTVAA
jgi:hypothetical protein